MASGIKDKVAILGMGCSHFGERWDVGSEQLMVEAFNEALVDADIERREIGAAWLGSALDQANVGNSAIPLSTALRMQGIPVTRVENMCATGTEALRGACYAVAAGAVDIALALGLEKPPKRRSKSESPSASAGEHRDDPRCADRRGAVGRIRLLRRERWRCLRDRHDA